MSNDLRNRSMQILLSQVSSGQYPSVSMLDRIEAAVNDRATANEYVNLLLDTLERDAYPSPTMLDRVLKLVEALERSQPPEE
jgi:hypothetical protein